MPLPRLSPRGRGMGIAIGSMKDQVTIQQRTGSNSYGKAGGTWTTFATTWAKLENLAGREIVAPAEYVAQITNRITIPYLAGLEPLMRIIFVDIDGKTHRYDILYFQDPEQRGMFLEILAQEIFDKQ